MSMELLDVAVRRGRYVPRPASTLKAEPRGSILIKAASHQWGPWHAPERARAFQEPVEKVNAASVADIKSLMYRRYRILPVELVSQNLTRSISDVRQIAMYLCCKYTTHSLPVIGTHFGDRDHTTVMHARNRLDARRKVEPKLDAVLLEMERALGMEPGAVVTKKAKPRASPLSAEIQRAILQSYIAGERVTVIARKFEVNCSTLPRLARAHGVPLRTGGRRRETEGFPGVFWKKKNKRWLAQIERGGKAVHLGYFPTAFAASQAVQRAVTP